MPKETIKIADKEFTAEELEKILSQNSQLQDSLKAGRLSAATGDALRRGVAPATVKFVEQVMSSTDPGAQPTIDVERPAGENGTDAEKTNLNMFGAMETLLGIIPGRIEPNGSEDDEDLDTSGQRPAANLHPYNYDQESDDAMTTDEAEAQAIARRKELGLGGDNAN